MEEDLSSSVKIAVLDQKLEDLKNVVVRVDDAIQKISEVNINVSRMLAVHDERISKQEQTDIVLFSKIDKLRDKIDLDHDSIRARLSLLERRIWTYCWSTGSSCSHKQSTSNKNDETLVFCGRKCYNQSSSCHV